jgi:hypothetical protein
MPSGVRCRRARNRTDRNCRAKRECGQGFFHHTISTSSHRKKSHVRYLTSFGRSPHRLTNVRARHAAGIGVNDWIVVIECGRR